VQIFLHIHEKAHSIAQIKKCSFLNIKMMLNLYQPDYKMFGEVINEKAERLVSVLLFCFLKITF